jgi:hypothetical protein
VSEWKEIIKNFVTTDGHYNKVLENTIFLKLDIFLSSRKGKETHALGFPVIMVSSFKETNRVGVPSLHPKTERDPVSETLCF